MAVLLVKKIPLEEVKEINPERFNYLTGLIPIFTKYGIAVSSQNMGIPLDSSLFTVHDIHCFDIIRGKIDSVIEKGVK